MVDVGPFRLIDPPEGGEEIVRLAISAIEYPWNRLNEVLYKDPEGAVIVEWRDTTNAGLFFSHTLRIFLQRNSWLDEMGQAFVFAHEVGHLIDRADLSEESRALLMELMHVYPGYQQPHESEWSNHNNPYPWRHHEAFADLFVAAFAPSLWVSNSYMSAIGFAPDRPRFIHWVDDLDAVRTIVMQDSPQPDPRDEPEPKPKEEPMARDPKIEHALQDLNVWLRRHPRRSKTRWKARAARRLLASIPPR